MPPGNRRGRFSRSVKFLFESVTAIWKGRKKLHIARVTLLLSSSASKRVGSACAPRRSAARGSVAALAAKGRQQTVVFF